MIPDSFWYRPLNVPRIEVLKFQQDKGVYRYLGGEISYKPTDKEYCGRNHLQIKGGLLVLGRRGKRNAVVFMHDQPFISLFLQYRGVAYAYRFRLPSLCGIHVQRFR